MTNRNACLLRMLLLTAICSIPSTGSSQDNVTKKSPQQQLVAARQLLRGEDKQEDAARQLLEKLARDHADDLSSWELCVVYVYLGYIEDREGKREAAIRWFKKAIPLEGPKIEGIREVAKHGLTEPITWIRHLDMNRRTQSKAKILQRIGDAVVSRDMPADLPSPQMDLSETERLENFELLWQAIDRWYSFFDHKNIDWAAVNTRYRPKVQAAETGEDYYRVLDQFVRELRDAHSWLCNHKDKNALQGFSPAVATRRIEGNAVVTYVPEKSKAAELGLRPGSIITRVDGLTVDERIEQLRPMLRVSSSERNFLESAYRRILHGEEGTAVSISHLPPGKNTSVELELVRHTPGMEEVHEPGFPVEKERFVWSGIHPSGLGYIRITSFMERMELADEFDRALEKLRDTPGLIIDIRENRGGFGTAHRRIIGRFLSESAAAGASYVRSGPAHNEFTRHGRQLLPTGPWQYTGPIALLLNPITGSASDLFALDMIAAAKPITVGTTTHGNSTGTCVFVTLPCNLVVRVSRGYTADNDGRIIEVNGNVPEIHAELTVDDILNGTDSVIDRAVQALQATSCCSSEECNDQPSF